MISTSDIESPVDSSWRVPIRWCPIRLSTSHSIWPTSGALSPWRSRLTKRAPSYFPPPSRGSVEIGNLSLVQVIRAMQTEQAAFVDPREKMLEEQRDSKPSLTSSRASSRWCPIRRSISPRNDPVKRVLS